MRLKPNAMVQKVKQSSFAMKSDELKSDELDQADSTAASADNADEDEITDEAEDEHGSRDWNAPSALSSVYLR